MFIRNVGGVVIAVLLAACGFLEPDPVVVETRISHAEVSASASIEVVVTITNASSRPVAIDDRGCPYVFEVRSAGSQEVVGPQTPICTLEGRQPLYLSAGASLTHTYRWGGLAVGRDGERLAPGDYRIRGWGTTSDGHRVYSDVLPVRVLPDLAARSAP